MFEVPKPRQFHYQPRFYDPEKERWEALKKKYATEQEKKAAEEAAAAPHEEDKKGASELEYFEQKVRSLDREARQQSSKLSWRDLFRKREMPQFRYQPRFSGGSTTATPAVEPAEEESLAEKYRQAKRQIKIRRRFDISDTDYMKPVSGTKIILYAFLVFLLLSLVFGF
ncbi:MAG: hypothetical protein IKG81_10840 [Bacteroidales bacterium]|nr:hypothetical protein [Bacteroidales bacterium]